MSQNSEQIEAKLCAYLEGELDEQGRAEIEKHLEQHPAHRKLLSEVGKTRGLLRALPREPAPPDICEAFQGQLERSVLLSDFDNSASGSSMKINRWPQHLAVAAVVVLAAGLGLVVFFGLPSGTPQSHYAVVGGGGGGRGGDVAATGKTEDGVVRAPAITEGASTAPAVPGTSTEMAGTRGPDSSSAVVPEGLERIPGGGAAKRGAAAITTPKVAEVPATAPAHDLPVLARRVQGAWDAKEREQLFKAKAEPDLVAEATTPEGTRDALAAVSSNAVYYVVNSPQPALTCAKIGDELNRMQVIWAQQNRPDPQTVQAKIESYRELATGSSNSNAGAIQVVTEAQQTNRFAAASADGSSRGVMRREAAPPAQQPAQLPAPRPAGPIAQKQEGAAASDAAAGVQAAPTSGPADRFAESKNATTAAPTATANGPSRGYGSASNTARRPETLIVARNLTRQQAATLSLSFDDQQLRQQLGERTDAEAPADPNVGLADATARQKENGASAGRVALRSRNEVALNITPPQEAQQPTRGDKPPDEARAPVRAARPAPTASAAPAPSQPPPPGAVESEAPAAAPQARTEPSNDKDTLRAGGISGAAVVRDSELRAGLKQTQDQPPASAATAPGTGGDERFDVVIVVQQDGASPATTADHPQGGLDQAADQPGPIEKHDILMIQLGDDESGLSSVRVGQDGTVEVPGAGSIKADGLTSSQLRDQIAGKLRENGADTKTVAVKRVGPSDAAAAPSNDVKPPSDESKPAPSTDNQAPAPAQKQQ